MNGQPTAAAQSDATPGRAGTVFDIGYQRYKGQREGRSRGRRSIFQDGVRTALGFGRGGRAKILPWSFIVILVLIGVIMALMAGAVNRFVGEGVAAALPSYPDFYGIASIVLFVFAAVVGPELLCPDRHQGVINLYLVRPITGTDYVASRWVAALTVIVGACWLPQLILLLGLALGSPEPVAYLRDNWIDIPKLMVAGLALAAYVTALAMLTASFTTRRAYASIFLVGLFIITTPFTTGLASEIGGTVGQWISMFNLTNIPVHVNDLIFGEESWITRGAPAGDLPGSLRIGWYFAWTMVPIVVVWARYRRLSP